MDLATVLTAFGTIFVAELPDKTMLATIVLSARFRRPLAVWLGAASALVAQMAIAVTAGRLLDLLPERPVRLAIAVLFAAGAIVLWRSARADPDAPLDVGGAELEAELGPGGPARLAMWRIAATVAGIVFLAEWGDLTQLATASLATRGEPLSVFAGAALAMVTVAGIGAAAGQGLLRVLPERVLRRVAAVIFAVLAVLAAVEAI